MLSGTIMRVWWWTSMVPFVRIRYCAAEPEEAAICIKAKSTTTADSDNLKIESNRGCEQVFVPFIDDRSEIQYTRMVEASTVFVDKSLLVKKIMEHESKVVLINSPTKSGKSINLSMLKSFFEIRVRKRDHLDVLPSTETSSYKFFTRGEIVNSGPHQFDSPLQSAECANGVPPPNEKTQNVFASYANPPLISKHKDMVDGHLAKYPVIYIDLALEVWLFAPTLVEGLKRQISDLYKKHAFLKQMLSTDAAVDSLKEFERMEKACERNAETNLTDEHLENSVLTLSKMLYQRLGGRPVIILVDEYIQPLEHHLLDAYRSYKGAQASEIKKGIRVLSNFMSKTFGENPFLKKAVLTGTLSVNNKDLFAGVTDLAHYNALHNELQTFYAFTEHEVRMLCRHFDIPEELAQQARAFYNGYTMKPSTANFTSFAVYNVWSMVNFVNKRLVRDYWTQSAQIFDKMRTWWDMEKIANVIRPLMNGDGDDTLRVTFVELDFGMGKSLHAFQPQSAGDDEKPPRKIGKKAIDSILSLFCQLGLLTNSDHVGRPRSRGVRIRIPNQEIRRAFAKYLPPAPAPAAAPALA